MKAKNWLLASGGMLFLALSQTAYSIPQGQPLFGGQKVEKTQQAPNPKTGDPAPAERFSFGEARSKVSQGAARQEVVKRPAPKKPKKSDETIAAEKMDSVLKLMQQVSYEIAALGVKKEQFGNVVSRAEVVGAPRFYIGAAIHYSFIAVKDKVRANPRTIKWNEQKVDYYGFVGSVFSFPKRDADGNIIYNAETGLPEYETRQNPCDDDDIKAFYDANGNLVGDQTQLKALLKKKVDLLIGASKDSNYQNSLMMVIKDKENCLWFRYANVYIGDNEYCDDPENQDTQNESEELAVNGQFYFAHDESDNDRLEYISGIKTLHNLKWKNLVFTGFRNSANKNVGPYLTFRQVLGEVIEQSFEGEVYTNAAGVKGMYTGLYSERYNDDGIDEFQRTVDLPEIKIDRRSYKSAFGGSIYGGFGGRSCSWYYGIELEAGFSNLKTTVSDGNKVCVNQTKFGNGNVRYIDKNEVLKNPVTNKEFKDGAVYDPNTGAVRPVHLTGLGRLTDAKALSLPDFTQGYKIEVKKGISFSVTPIIGFCHANTVYYAALGLTMNRYKVSIKPNVELLNKYNDVLPAPALLGVPDDLTGNTYLHKYRLRKNDEGDMVAVDDVRTEKNKRANYKMEPTYPSAPVEQNSAGEQNIFCGVRLIYPSHKDGGISVVGESNPVDSKYAERPWMDESLRAQSLRDVKVTKCKWTFEPGIGFRTYFSQWFVDLRYSVELTQSITVKHPEFAAFPVHLGRSGAIHTLSISGHKIRLSTGCNLN